MEAPVFPEAVFTLDETFDQLSTALIEKPDDEIALSSLKEHFAAAYESGAVEEVMQMAMALGAMACMGHEHLGSLAEEMSALYGIDGEQHQGHDHTHGDEATDTKATKKLSANRRERLTLWAMLLKAVEGRRFQ